jgi:nitroimidazol reductase NimA-like FMN-containing flavoprotein (pyridoxamine 5'-phosphate oxidase superfamily)
MNAAEQARYLIEHNLFLTLATANASGVPWATPVGFVYDTAYNFYWISEQATRHSHNITIRPDVALSIYGQIPNAGLDALYIDAEASIVNSGTEIQKVINLFAKNRPQPPRFRIISADQVSGDATRRIYKATPNEITKRINKTIGGQAISTRESVEL